MLGSSLTLFRKSVLSAIFGSNDLTHFWHARFLPRWLPLLLGIGLGVILAFLIANGLWHLALPLALAVPAIIVFNKYPFVAVLLWLLILPYFLNEPTSAGRFIYWIIHRAIIPLALGVVILSDWLGTDQKKGVKFGRAELSMLIFMGLLSINIILFSQDTERAFIEAYDRIFIPFCMYWLIRLVAPTDKDLKRFLWVAFITVVVQAVIGVISWFAPELLPSKWLFGLEGARTVGTLRNVAVYTSTLLFCALLLFHYAMHSASKWLRFGLLLTFGLALYCIFMSFSRGSWLGGILVTVVLIFTYPKVMLRFSLLLAVLIFFLSSSLLADQVAWGYERLTGEASKVSAESRVTANDASLSMLKAEPLFGWGYNNYDEAKQPFMRRVGEIKIYDTTSHNTYLTILAEQGVPSFIFFVFPTIWWFILTLKVWRRLPRQGFRSRPLLLMLWLVLLHMFVVSNFMDMVRLHPFGTTIWWMVLGFIGSVVYPQLRSDDIGRPQWALKARRH